MIDAQAIIYPIAPRLPEDDNSMTVELPLLKPDYLGHQYRDALAESSSRGETACENGLAGGNREIRMICPQHFEGR